MKRAVVELGLRCNNACIFCAQAGGEELARDVEQQLRAARAVADEVTFVGGEPTLEPALEDAVACARSLGFRAIGLQTNGRLLARADQARRLARLGLTDVHLSLHGARAAVHDYHVGVEGAFIEAVAGLAAACAAGLTAVVATVLTRSNGRVLAELPWFLRSRGARAWLIEIPRNAGRMAGAFDRVYPRLAVALPFALHALQLAERMALPAWIRGAPHCLLGPFVERGAPDEPRRFAPVCDGCGERARCPGLDAVYLSRFGGDELRPRALEAATMTSAPAPSELAAFVGIGRHVAVETRAAAEPPVAAHKSLPIAGKVQPARQEVPANAPRKTGEALQEIFPGLFAKPDGR